MNRKNQKIKLISIITIIIVLLILLIETSMLDFQKKTEQKAKTFEEICSRDIANNKAINTAYNALNSRQREEIEQPCTLTKVDTVPVNKALLSKPIIDNKLSLYENKDILQVEFRSKHYDELGNIIVFVAPDTYEILGYAGRD